MRAEYTNNSTGTNAKIPTPCCQGNLNFCFELAIPWASQQHNGSAIARTKCADSSGHLKPHVCTSFAKLAKTVPLKFEQIIQSGSGPAWRTSTRRV